MFNAILELTKYRLSLSVLFSSIAGYLIAMDFFSVESFLLLLIGGFFLVGASNGFNQIIERERDALMDRTKNRPIPLGKISPKFAFVICLIMILSGIVLLYLINFRTAFFGLISALIYAEPFIRKVSSTPGTNKIIPTLGFSIILLKLSSRLFPGQSGNKIVLLSLTLIKPGLPPFGEASNDPFAPDVDKIQNGESDK